ncbi:hypothetical protein BDY19DRAFT_555547 [Irpex rosettiformis]|uniref:Uncharacterized protein n=1 Tax=Irpex rosettiformis TaxID=378272 RepID=A0ACB8TPZ2_9APHY|nr:hypothetical protein BDY19DRAFT_555547 [Irpex rosettiformis]
MADARTLLKAKRQEARVNHPLASYNSAGQLRCVACGTNVKHTSSWEGHVGSKAHRINAGRMRGEQQKKAEEELRLRNNEKRKVDDNEDKEMEEESGVKRQKLISDTQGILVKQSSPTIITSFPTDFFSDLSKTRSSSVADDEDEDDEATTNTNLTSVDVEWAKFKQTVLDAPDERERYERATIFAEPVLAAEVPEGFLAHESTGGQPEHVTPSSKEGLRRKKEKDERELIMDRLVEEERAQEEADAKVSMLKQRLENLRKQRAKAKQT